ncbi:MAG: hypothetical protein KIG33_05715 [Oscillospiraceae bacterium]|nr:hypothetical protein [Oscillospiraceae bacterium]
MTEEDFLREVRSAAGIITEDNDVINQLRIKALAVMRYINNGGGNITPENATEYEIQTIANGVNDLLNQNGGGFSEGFEAMAQQIQLRGGGE